MRPVNSRYWMHGERKWYISTFFESISCPFYKTDDAQAYFVDQWDWMHSFNFGNSLKPTSAKLNSCVQSALIHSTPVRHLYNNCYYPMVLVTTWFPCTTKPQFLVILRTRPLSWGHILLVYHKWEDLKRAPKISKAKQWFWRGALRPIIGASEVMALVAFN